MFPNVKFTASYAQANFDSCHFGYRMEIMKNSVIFYTINFGLQNHAGVEPRNSKVANARLHNVSVILFVRKFV